MSIEEEVQRRADELWEHWKKLGPRVNSVPEVERIARRELMARYIKEGNLEPLVQLVLAADHDDGFNDVDTLACALAEKGDFKGAFNLWERVLGRLERLHRKGQRAHPAYLRARGLDEDSVDAQAARVTLIETHRVDLLRAYNRYRNLVAVHAGAARGELWRQVDERRARLFTAPTPEEGIIKDPRDMTEDVLWELVKQSGADGRSGADRVQALALRLRGFRPKEIVRFGKSVAGLVRQAYTWELWGAAYLLNGGCSDDGFLYFCGWLILQGRERCHAAVRDPESIADWWAPGVNDPPETEELLYVAAEVYEEVTGKDAPGSVTVAVGKPRGQRWEEDALAARFPRLWRRLQ
jgi:hypothetical protein